MSIKVPPPDVQVKFAASLLESRSILFQEALLETVEALSRYDLDAELAVYAPAHTLAVLNEHGLSGEMVFPVPSLLRANPRLLGYYRLLYGYSQKEFYGAGSSLGRFKSMEERGTIGRAAAGDVEDLVKGLCEAAALLIMGIGPDKITATFLDDLTLLTFGPQLRGGANVQKGAAGIQTVFNTIHDIVQGSVLTTTSSMMEIKNATGRTVFIQFAPDPDIIIREQMGSGNFRNIIAIEVKAGSDFSNIHNRIGEAEKSHQKAKAGADGYTECWTVVNVDKIDLAMARQESPSTNRFYRISDLVAGEGADYEDFVERLVSLTGITSILVR
ncbi:MAG: XcyI family restriction endonuclease [Tabrizicola sp.]|uniref:XcyI family restriction endonuclease n=1 Tax=Tabrizicola sp. TaxID=2005166 RepID=UPI003BAE3DD7